MKKRHSAEQIVAKLREADVSLGKELRVPEVCKHPGISEQTCYRWRMKCCGMDPQMAEHQHTLKKQTNWVAGFVSHVSQNRRSDNSRPTP